MTGPLLHVVIRSGEGKQTCTEMQLQTATVNYIFPVMFFLLYVDKYLE